MLTCFLGYFWSLPRGVSPRLEWGHARALSSRAVTALSRFPSSGSRDIPTVHTTSERSLLALYKCSGPAHDLQHSRPRPALKGDPRLGASGLGARKKPCSGKAHPLFPLQEARVQGPQSSDPLVVVHCSSWRCPKSKSHTVHQASPSYGPRLSSPAVPLLGTGCQSLSST